VIGWPFRQFVATHLSRRLFVLFALSAFVPLAGIALLSLTQVRSLLLQQGGQRLAATAKTYGMAVFERVLVAGDIAVAAAFHPRVGIAEDTRTTRTFAALSLMDGDNVFAMLGPPLAPRFSAETRERLAIGKPAIMGRATKHLLPQPRVMSFAMRMMANLTDGRGGGAKDRRVWLGGRLAGIR